MWTFLAEAAALAFLFGYARERQTNSPPEQDSGKVSKQKPVHSEQQNRPPTRYEAASTSSGPSSAEKKGEMHPPGKVGRGSNPVPSPAPSPRSTKQLREEGKKAAQKAWQQMGGWYEKGKDSAGAEKARGFIKKVWRKGLEEAVEETEKQLEDQPKEQTHSQTPPEPLPTKPKQPSRKVVVDPVCGAEIPWALAVSLKHGQESIYFCSEGCRTEFIKGNRNHG